MTSRLRHDTRRPRDAHRQNLIAVRGMRSQSGSGAHLYHKAVFIACHSATPPPVEKYDAWLAAQLNERSKFSHSTITGTKLRRMVIMKRGGQSHRDIGDAIGMNGATAARWLKALPPELAA